MWWMIIGGCVTGYQQAQAERCVEAIRALDEDGDGAVKEELELPEGCEGLDMDELLERYELVPGDCDDEDPGRAPGRKEELCDKIDQDCDGQDLGGSDWYWDGDGDGYGTAASKRTACEAEEGWVANGSDCDDGDPAISPDAEQIGCGPNAVDTDCDDEQDCAVLEEDGRDFIYLGEDQGGVLDVGVGLAWIKVEDLILELSGPELYERVVLEWVDDDAWVEDLLGLAQDADLILAIGEYDSEYLMRTGQHLLIEALSDVEARQITGCHTMDMDCVGFDSLHSYLAIAARRKMTFSRNELYIVDTSALTDNVDLSDLTPALTDFGSEESTPVSVSLFGEEGGLLAAIGMDYGSREPGGEVVVYYQEEDSTIAVTASLPEEMGSFGTSVLLMDLDGSGSLDLLVSAPEEDLLYLFLDPTGDLTTSDADLTFSGTSQTGLSLANAGDINGDGQDDLLVGAEDTVYLFLGGELSYDWEPYATLEGSPGSELGADLAGADLDQDGYSDLILGAPGDGGVYVLWGGP